MRATRWEDLKRINNTEGQGFVIKRVIEGKIYSLEPFSEKYINYNGLCIRLRKRNILILG